MSSGGTGIGAKRTVNVHGEKGVYHGGEWVDMETYGKKVVETKRKISEAKLKSKGAVSGGGSKGECGDDCATCPRSQSCHSSVKQDGTYDVIIIGAGCIGAAIARELSKTTASVLWLEAADDVSQGATKGNSGIVHAGFDDKPGSVRSKFCWKGNQMFPQLDKELNFGYQKNGSLVLANKEEEIKVLEELLERGKKNGVQNLKILNKEECFRREPYLNPDTIAALYSPDAGNLIPYEFTIALAENAVDNGVELKIRREVNAISTIDDGIFEVKARYWEPSCYVDNVAATSWGKKRKIGTIVASSVVLIAGILIAWADKLTEKAATHVGSATKEWFYAIAGVLCLYAVYVLTKAFKAPKGSKNWKELFKRASKPVGVKDASVSVEDMSKGGSGSAKIMDGKTVAVETYKARYIVNCAGTFSDKISKMIGDDSFKMKPRVGDYLLLRKEEGYLATHTLFPCPHPVLGKGVLVQTTLWGNLILGPTARDMHDPKIASETADDIQTYILSKCKQLVPDFDAKKVFNAFAGVRAKTDKGDWIIEPSSKNRKFIQAAGIDSPGLAGSPAIALEVVRLLENAGLKTEKNVNFNPYRAPIIVPKYEWRNLKFNKDAEKTDDSDPSKHVVCKCEKVTEAEVVDAIHRSLPIDSTQAMRKRTRAGMGYCQAEVDNYNCECRVAAIIARETGIPVEAVGRRPFPATSTLSQRWISEAEKNNFDTLKAKSETR